MNRLRERRTVRWIVVAALAVVALALWSASASAQPQPPFLLYGEGEPGDIVTVSDSDGQELGMAVVMPDNSWHVNVLCDGDKVQTLSFQVNGAAADAEIDQTGADQAEVALVAAAGSATESATGSATESDGETSDDEMTDDEMTDEDDPSMDADDDSMMGEDDSMMGDDDSMMGEDDSMMGDDDSMIDDEQMDDGAMSDQATADTYPDSGSGGLTKSGPSREALVGTIAVLVAVGVLAVAGLGVRRARRTRSQA